MRMTFDEATEWLQQGLVLNQPRRIQRQGWADVAVGAGDRGGMWIELMDDPLDEGDDVPPHPFLVIERAGMPKRIVRYVRTATDKSATDWIEVT
jgi:hypothetical protein